MSKQIKFSRWYQRWNRGETATFSDEVATKLIDRGVAVLVLDNASPPKTEARDGVMDKMVREPQRRAQRGAR